MNQTRFGSSFIPHPSSLLVAPAAAGGAVPARAGGRGWIGAGCGAFVSRTGCAAPGSGPGGGGTTPPGCRFADRLPACSVRTGPAGRRRRLAADVPATGRGWAALLRPTTRTGRLTNAAIPGAGFRPAESTPRPGPPALPRSAGLPATPAPPAPPFHSGAVDRLALP